MWKELQLLMIGMLVLGRVWLVLVMVMRVELWRSRGERGRSSVEGGGCEAWQGLLGRLRWRHEELPWVWGRA